VNSQRMTEKLIFFTVLVFALWGPKLGGYLDLMVLVPAVGVFVLAVTSTRMHLPLNIYVNSGLIASGIVVWGVISMLINGARDPQGVLRSARAVVTLLILFPLFYFAAKQRIFSMEGAFKLLIGVMLLNAVAVYLQIFYMPVQELMSVVWGFNKTIREGRAFGLTAGYDTAGYLIAFASSATLAASTILRSWRWLLTSLFAAVAVGFTSRTSMLLFFALVVLSLLLTKSYWRGNGLRIIVILAGSGAAAAMFMLPRLAAGVTELAWLKDDDEEDFTEYYAHTSITDVIHSMVDFPGNLVGWLMGEGQMPDWSDVGYVKIIYLGGLPLLLLMMVFYGYLVGTAKLALHTCMRRARFDRNEVSWILIWLLLLLFLSAIMLLGNFKNLYLFARGYHELFVVVSALSMGFARSFELNYTDNAGQEKGGPSSI